FKSKCRSLRRATGRAQLRQKHCIAKNKLRARIFGHTPYKISGSEYVQGHSKHAAQHAPVKGRNPFCAVFTPDQNTVALTHASRIEQRSKSPGKLRQLPICRHAPPV